METLAGRPIERFTPHDFRRTTRSNTKRLRIDFETAEAMLNHVKKGLERTYDTYELEEEKRAWFLAWETEIARIARKAGVAEALGVPTSPSAMLNPPERPSFGCVELGSGREVQTLEVATPAAGLVEARLHMGDRA